MSQERPVAVRRDVRLIFFAQAVRALAYGFASVSLGALLASRGWSGAHALLLARHALGQMDVPARQAYVAALVDPDERTAAAATPTPRARWCGPWLPGRAA